MPKIPDAVLIIIDANISKKSANIVKHLTFELIIPYN